MQRKDHRVRHRPSAVWHIDIIITLGSLLAAGGDGQVRHRYSMSETGTVLVPVPTQSPAMHAVPLQWGVVLPTLDALPSILRIMGFMTLSLIKIS